MTAAGPRAHAPDRASYALEVLARLYPEPLRVGVDGQNGEAEQARFLLLPNPRHVRLVVPAGNRHASARAVHRQLTGTRPRTRLARLLLTLAVASGGADRLARGTLVVTGPTGADSVERTLADLLGAERVLVSLPISPPRANRKPVLQVCDEQGRALAFVKIGHDPLTRRLVAAESSVLERVAAAALPHLRVPGVIARVEWHDLCLLVLEPLPLPSRQLGGDTARRAFLAAAREISGLGGIRRLPWAASPFRAALDADLAACGPRGQALRAHLSALDAAPPRLALGAWHGDLNPGNVALLEGTSLVWDWERFAEDVPVGFDVLHHDLHQDVTVSGVSPAVAAARLIATAPATLAALDVEPDAADATARLYLLALAARYLHDQQAEAGAALGDVESWLLPALSRPRRPSA